MRNLFRHRAWTPHRSRSLLLIFALILATSIFDAWATLQFIKLGEEEANFFVLRQALLIGPTCFLITKTVLTFCPTLPLLFIVRYQAGRPRLAWGVLCGTAIIFVTLALLHIYHLSLPIPPALVTHIH